MSEANDSQQPVENGVNELLQQENYGLVLREAREKAGLSINEVSEKILISVDILKAIENSQSEALPSIAFVQGYIRSYAKILNVQADNIINAYLKTVPEQQALSPKGIVSSSQANNSLFIVAVFIVLLVVSGSVYWLFVKLPDSQGFDIPVEDDVFTQVEQFSGNEELLVESDVLSVQMSPEDSQEKLQKESAVDDYQLTDPADPTGPTDPVSIVEEVIEKTEHPIIQDEINNTALTDSIIINAQEDTWCELKDAQGNRLVYRLVNKGELLKFKGKAPFSIFLGVSSAVDINVNQKSINYDHLLEQGKKTILLEIPSSGEVRRLRRN